jgi:hypothetical protein
MLADDGKSFALQCDRKTVTLWRDGSRELVSQESDSLFFAARQASIISPTWRCPLLNMQEKPLRFSIRFADSNDCNVYDRTNDKSSYIVETPGSFAFYLITPLPPGTTSPDPEAIGVFAVLRAKELGWSDMPDSSMPIVGGEGLQVRDMSARGSGVLLPRVGATAELVVPALDSASLQALALDGSGIRQVSKVHQAGEYFRNISDFNFTNVHYSSSHKLLIVEGGRISSGLSTAYVRAYALDGTEQWVLREWGGASRGFFSYARLILFNGGRYAAVNYHVSAHTGPTFDIVDIEDGDILGSYRGYAIAASAHANRVLVEDDSQRFTLVDYTPLVDPSGKYSNHAR